MVDDFSRCAGAGTRARGLEMRFISMMAIAALVTLAALPLPTPGSARDSEFMCDVNGGSFVLDDADFAAMAKGGMTREKFAASSLGSPIRVSVCDTRKLWRLVRAGSLSGCDLVRYKHWVPEYFAKDEIRVSFDPMNKASDDLEFGRSKCPQKP
jgi:hypothetical protein